MTKNLRTLLFLMLGVFALVLNRTKAASAYTYGCPCGFTAQGNPPVYVCNDCSGVPPPPPSGSCTTNCTQPPPPAGGPSGTPTGGGSSSPPPPPCPRPNGTETTTGNCLQYPIPPVGECKKSVCYVTTYQCGKKISTCYGIMTAPSYTCVVTGCDSN